MTRSTAGSRESGRSSRSRGLPAGQGLADPLHLVGHRRGDLGGLLGQVDAQEPRGGPAEPDGLAGQPAVDGVADRLLEVLDRPGDGRGLGRAVADRPIPVVGQGRVVAREVVAAGVPGLDRQGDRPVQVPPPVRRDLLVGDLAELVVGEPEQAVAALLQDLGDQQGLDGGHRLGLAEQARRPRAARRRPRGRRRRPAPGAAGRRRRARRAGGRPGRGSSRAGGSPRRAPRGRPGRPRPSQGRQRPASSRRSSPSATAARRYSATKNGLPLGPPGQVADEPVVGLVRAEHLADDLAEAVLARAGRRRRRWRPGRPGDTPSSRRPPPRSGRPRRSPRWASPRRRRGRGPGSGGSGRRPTGGRRGRRPPARSGRTRRGSRPGPRSAGTGGRRRPASAGGSGVVAEPGQARPAPARTRPGPGRRARAAAPTSPGPVLQAGVGDRLEEGPERVERGGPDARAVVPLDRRRRSAGIRRSPPSGRPRSSRRASSMITRVLPTPLWPRRKMQWPGPVQGPADVPLQLGQDRRPGRRTPADRGSRATGRSAAQSPGSQPEPGQAPPRRPGRSPAGRRPAWPGAGGSALQLLGDVARPARGAGPAATLTWARSVPPAVPARNGTRPVTPS